MKTVEETLAMVIQDQREEIASLKKQVGELIFAHADPLIPIGDYDWVQFPGSGKWRVECPSGEPTTKHRFYEVR